MKTVELMVTRNCNLRCKYCYEGRDKAAQTISIEIIKKAIDTLKPDYLTFFGGEPLLNRYLIKYGLSYGKDNGVQNFKIISNGTLITPDFLKEIKDYNVNFTISMDGIKESHNITRGCFDLVDTGMDLLTKYKIPYNIRGTFIPETIRYLYESYKYMLTKTPTGIQLQPADSGYYEYTYEDYKLIENQMLLIKKEYLKRRLCGRTPYISMGQSYNSDKRFCGAGVNYLCVDYDGSIFPCHRAVFINNAKMGHIDIGIDIYKNGCYARVTRADLKCDPSCPIINICNGTCYMANFFSNGNFYFPDKTLCEFKKTYARVGGMPV